MDLRPLSMYCGRGEASKCFQYLKTLDRFSCGDQDVKEAGLPAPWEPLVIE
jgi:hypothetical protein